jgi:hypothetical protein
MMHTGEPTLARIPKGDEVWTSPIKPRTQGEQDAYMAGQRAALVLAREEGIDYAERIVKLTQDSITRERESDSLMGEPATLELRDAILAWNHHGAELGRQKALSWARSWLK